MVVVSAPKTGAKGVEGTICGDLGHADDTSVPVTGLSRCIVGVVHDTQVCGDGFGQGTARKNTRRRDHARGIFPRLGPGEAVVDSEGNREDYESNPVTLMWSDSELERYTCGKLVAHHATSRGVDTDDAVPHSAVALEFCARMASETVALRPPGK